MSVGGINLDGVNPYIPLDLTKSYNIKNNAYAAHPLKIENDSCRDANNCNLLIVFIN